jgi:ACS family hexuronate transporter-like MFS transporter
MTKRPIRHLRWYIAVLLCLATELNYLDRQTLSVLADTIQRELNLTTIDYSHITSAFLVSYAVMYAVSGRVIDIVGTRRGFLIFVSAVDHEHAARTCKHGTSVLSLSVLTGRSGTG